MDVSLLAGLEGETIRAGVSLLVVAVADGLNWAPPLLLLLLLLPSLHDALLFHLLATRRLDPMRVEYF